METLMQDPVLLLRQVVLLKPYQRTNTHTQKLWVPHSPIPAQGDESDLGQACLNLPQNVRQEQ